MKNQIWGGRHYNLQHAPGSRKAAKNYYTMTAIETLKEAYLVGCLEINPGGVDTWDSQRVMTTEK